MKFPLTAEWLEADGLGGFASGTVGGGRTRRYHAWLLAALADGRRLVLVNGADVTLQTAAGTWPLSTQFYGGGATSPDGRKWLASFEPEPWPQWVFALPDGTRVAQELCARRGRAQVFLRWRLVAGGGTAATLRVRPLLSGRDYHGLQRENGGFHFEPDVQGDRLCFRTYQDQPEIVLASNGRYNHQPYWYGWFHYDEEDARGLDCEEDLGSPGELTFELTRGPAHLVLASGDLEPGPVDGLAGQTWQAEQARRAAFVSPLHRAAEAYVIEGRGGKTIIAGYPWFTDWGRDTFISLRGLCLATGGVADARAVLLRWAGAVSQGMLPNRFPDHGEAPEYNAVDASLWFVVAVYELLQAAQGVAFVPNAERARLLGAVEAILSGYADGTRHRIAATDDGLLAAGEPGVQLTWMDAKIGDWVVTPRIGKPVEVQALWLNALWIAVRLGTTSAARWQDLLDRGRASFAARFWNEGEGALHDVVDVDHQPGTVDPTFRPNQILAVGGLPLALLEGDRARPGSPDRMFVQDHTWQRVVQLAIQGVPNTLSAFQQDAGADGLVNIEAEHYTTRKLQGGHDWTPATPAGFSGDGAVAATPNSGANVTSGITSNSPRLDFKVNFVKTGTHYLWVRGYGPTSNDDLVHAGLDGQVATTADSMGPFPSGGAWRGADAGGARATITVGTTGEHTVSLWMQKDGFITDEILLTTNAAYTPTGAEPESPRPASGGSTVTVTLPAAADAHVRDGSSATVNFGLAAALEQKRSTVAGNNRRTFVRFDLAGVTGTVSAARLRLNGNSVTSAKLVGVYAVSDVGWGETTITWNTAPTIGLKQGASQSVGTSAAWVEWDVGSYVAAQKAAGATAVSFELRQDVANNEAPTTFKSRQATGTRPELLVTAGSPGGNQPPTVATPPAANPNPVNATTTALSVLGADDGGEPALGYTWSATGPAAVTFSANTSNAAKATTATFTASGSYELTVVIRDAGNLSASASLTVPVTIPGGGGTVTLPAAADAHVRDGSNATVNFGNAVALEQKHSTAVGNNRRTFVRFDLGGVTGAVSAARLRVNGNSVTSAKLVGVYAVSDVGWGETTITWNTAPVIGPKQGASQSVGTTAAWIEWDVTGYVAAQKAAGATAVSFELKQDVANNETPTSFTSKQATSNRPELRVTSP